METVDYIVIRNAQVVLGHIGVNLAGRSFDWQVVFNCGWDRRRRDAAVLMLKGRLGCSLKGVTPVTPVDLAF